MNDIKLSLLSVFSLALICSACSPVAFQSVDSNLIIQGAETQIKDTDIFDLNSGGGVSASADSEDSEVYVESSLGAVSTASFSIPATSDTQLNLGFLATLFEVSF